MTGIKLIILYYECYDDLPDFWEAIKQKLIWKEKLYSNKIKYGNIALDMLERPIISPPTFMWKFHLPVIKRLNNLEMNDEILNKRMKSQEIQSILESNSRFFGKTVVFKYRIITRKSKAIRSYRHSSNATHPYYIWYMHMIKLFQHAKGNYIFSGKKTKNTKKVGIGGWRSISTSRGATSNLGYCTPLRH